MPCRIQLIMRWVVTDPDAEALSNLSFALTGNAAYPPSLPTAIRRSGWRLSVSHLTPVTPSSSALQVTAERSQSPSSPVMTDFGRTVRLVRRLQAALMPCARTVRLASLTLIPHQHVDLSAPKTATS